VAECRDSKRAKDASTAATAASVTAAAGAAPAAVAPSPAKVGARRARLVPTKWVSEGVQHINVNLCVVLVVRAPMSVRLIQFNTGSIRIYTYHYQTSAESSLVKSRCRSERMLTAYGGSGLTATAGVEKVWIQISQ
jgi:hypothetical protein